VSLESGLAGRACLVTGAAKGIGGACADILAREGARLVLVDTDKDGLDALQLPEQQEALRLKVDVSQPAEVDALFERIRSDVGALHVLIHCAAIYRTTPLPSLTEEEWRLVLDVNLQSSFLLVKHAVEAMRVDGDGRIVLFGSFAARSGGLRASAAYSASKAGVEGLMRHAAAYAGPLGIRVNCIHPGFTDTPMTTVLAEEARQEAIDRTPLRRTSDPSEQAFMAVVLASDLASFVHGVALDVNGGLYMA
jgi:3-oxoacyl-[acyl-carrier protein] reductase